MNKVKPTYYLDTKSIKRDEQLLKVMHCRKKAEKTKLLHNFGLDAVDRCTVEINQV